MSHRVLLVSALSMLTVACGRDPISPAPRENALRPSNHAILVDTIAVELRDASSETPTAVEPRDVRHPHPTPLPKPTDPEWLY